MNHLLILDVAKLITFMWQPHGLLQLYNVKIHCGNEAVRNILQKRLLRNLLILKALA